MFYLYPTIVFPLANAHDRVQLSFRPLPWSTRQSIHFHAPTGKKAVGFLPPGRDRSNFTTLWLSFFTQTSQVLRVRTASLLWAPSVAALNGLTSSTRVAAACSALDEVVVRKRPSSLPSVSVMVIKLNLFSPLTPQFYAIVSLSRNGKKRIATTYLLRIMQK